MKQERLVSILSDPGREKRQNIKMIAALLGITLLGQSPRPVATCVDLKGNQVIPLSKPASKVTVLIFYLAHCPISQKMTPEINRIHKEFAGKGVKIYMIHEDLTLSHADVAKEAKEFELLPPVLVDKWRNQKKMSGVTISPEAVVYDSQHQIQYQGRINDQFYGLGKMRPKVTSRDLRDAVASVVEGKPVKVKKTEAIGCILPR